MVRGAAEARVPANLGRRLRPMGGHGRPRVRIHLLSPAFTPNEGKAHMRYRTQRDGERLAGWVRDAVAVGVAIVFLLAAAPHPLLSQSEPLVKAPLIDRGYSVKPVGGSANVPGLIPSLLLNNATPNRGESV